jgi:hypothetical protein
LCCPHPRAQWPSYAQKDEQKAERALELELELEPELERALGLGQK